MSDTFPNQSPAPDVDYFATRAEAERRLAETASDDRVRYAHEQLASEYERKARSGIAND